MDPHERAAGVAPEAPISAIQVSPTRRSVLWAAGGVAALSCTGAGSSAWYRSRHTVVPLYSTTVAFSGRSARALVAAGAERTVLPGSRVLRAAPASTELRARERDWLAASSSWTRAGRWEALAQSALLDLRVLSAGLRAPVAGWSPHWRYVWPRDAAHVAAALAATGHAREAVPIFAFLQGVQRPDGWFEARYLPDGSGVPDARPPQLDNVGWVLWAAAQVSDALPESESAAHLSVVAPMLTRCVEVILREIDNPAGLPPASPDYWETAEHELTLGTVAPLAAGLSGAARVFARLHDTTMHTRAHDGALALNAAIHRAFAPNGYARYADGHDRDAAVAFLLPPYSDAKTPAVITAFGKATRELARPGGGLAPGAAWKSDGISWTPETALFALAAASIGDHVTAEGLLDWLASHRTTAGSFSEKVLYDGRPAAVAPLAWTAALVLLTLKALRA